MSSRNSLQLTSEFRVSLAPEAEDLDPDTPVGAVTAAGQAAREYREDPTDPDETANRLLRLNPEELLALYGAHRECRAPLGPWAPAGRAYQAGHQRRAMGAATGALSPDQIKALGVSGQLQAVVVGEECRPLQLSRDEDRRREVDGVKAAQAVAFGQSASELAEGGVNVDDRERLPVLIELGDELLVLRALEVSLAQAAGQGAASLGVGDGAGGSDLCGLDGSDDLLGAGFDHIQLHQRAGVKVEDHRRSSITASDNDAPSGMRIRGAKRGFGPLGRCNSGPADGIGATWATGWPLAVITVASPLRARRMTVAAGPSKSETLAVCAGMGASSVLLQPDSIPSPQGWRLGGRSVRPGAGNESKEVAK